jgi:hypothetical protein
MLNNVKRKMDNILIGMLKGAKAIMLENNASISAYKPKKIVSASPLHFGLCVAVMPALNPIFASSDSDISLPVLPQYGQGPIWSFVNSFLQWRQLTVPVI